MAIEKRELKKPGILKKIGNRFSALALSGLLLFGAKCAPPKVSSEIEAPKTALVSEKREKEFSGKLGELLPRLHEPALYSEPRDSVRFREKELRDFLALKRNKLVADKKTGLLHLLNGKNEIVFSVPWVGSPNAPKTQDRYFMGDMATPEGIGEITGKSLGGKYFGRFQINWGRRHSSVYSDISREEMARYINGLHFREHKRFLTKEELAQIKSGREIVDAFKKRHGFVPSTESQISQFNSFVSSLKAGKEAYPQMGTVIYLHGGGSSEPWTHGCIAVEDEHFSQLFKQISAPSKILVLPFGHHLKYPGGGGEKLLRESAELDLGEIKFFAKGKR